MDRTNKQWLAVPLACVLLGLAGCAMLERETTTTTQAPERSIMGASSRYVPVSLSPSDCMKFEAMPQECEVLLRK